MSGKSYLPAIVLFTMVSETAIISDIVTKRMAESSLSAGQEAAGALPGITNCLTGNTGAAFSLMQGMTATLNTLAIAVALACVALVAVAGPRPYVTISLALIAGGALGNAIDRMGDGVVTDFIRLDLLPFAVFNVADACAFAGGAALIAMIVATVHDAGAAAPLPRPYRA